MWKPSCVPHTSVLERLFVCAHARTECCAQMCVLGVFVYEDGTADGFEYTGSWKNDEMDGEFNVCFVFGMKDDKVPMRQLSTHFSEKLIFEHLARCARVRFNLVR